MRVKILLAGSDRTIVAEVSEAEYKRADADLESPGAVWLHCTDVDSGWPYRLNLAQVVRLERAAT